MWKLTLNLVYVDKQLWKEFYKHPVYILCEVNTDIIIIVATNCVALGLVILWTKYNYMHFLFAQFKISLQQLIIQSGLCRVHMENK